jgi:ATP-dependent RNA helicase DeaD
MTPEKMPEFLSRESGINDLQLETIEVFSKFSFITVSKNQADMLLNRFADMRKRNRPFVELAMNSNVRDDRKK